MKAFLFALILSVVLIGGAIWCECAVTDECDRFISIVESSENISHLYEEWDRFSQIVAFVTPYDLIRSANSACQNYCSLTSSNGTTAEIEAARSGFISALREIRRVHALSWELIF